jgi:hypothetical protein
MPVGNNGGDVGEKDGGVGEYCMLIMLEYFVAISIMGAIMKMATKKT